MKKGRKIMMIFLGTALLFNLFGCDKKEEEPTSGDNTTVIDENAPKKIESKKICELYAPMNIATRWHGDEDHDFEFEIKKDEKGILTAYENVTGIFAECDEDLLYDLQAVIDKRDLASLNGVYDVTAGLAPEMEEKQFRVEYESGEKIEFTRNNQPYSLWGEEFYDVFAKWFEEKGMNDLYPDKEDTQVTRIRFWFMEDKVRKEYGLMKKGDSYVLNKSVYDFKKEKSVYDKSVKIPKDFYEEITRIADSYELVRRYDFSSYDYDNNNYGNHGRGYYGFGEKPQGEEDSTDMSLTLHLEYESGKRVNIDTKKESEIKAMRSLIDELLNYLDKAF